MNVSQLQAIRRHFHQYAKSYMARAGSMISMMELKRTHCAFVARNCRELAQGEGWSVDEVNTAEALGFLHDIGRFPQLEEYGTFADDESINHGERGYQALIESDLLHEMEADRMEAVLNAVRYHNARILEPGLPERHYTYLKLIRDADRLDIYRVVYEALAEDQIAMHPEIVLGLPCDPLPSPTVLESIHRKESVSYQDLTCATDFYLLILSWSYQMNFAAALRLMNQRSIIDQFKAYLPMERPDVRAIMENIEQYIKSGQMKE